MNSAILPLVLATLVLGVSGGGYIECPSIDPGRWGKVSCTNDLRYNSVCTLSCEEHYDLAGTTDTSIETTCGFDQTWSTSTEFLCVPIRCFPDLKPPTDGDLICSASNLAESLCVFFCDEHHDMRDVDSDRTAYAVCKDDGNGDEFGEWKQVESGVVFPPRLPPLCDAVRCESQPEAPENGQVICSNDDISGSTCVYYCDAGYRFEGMNSPVIFTTCQDDEDFDRFGLWTVSDIPSCQRYSMDPSCGSPPSIDGVEFDCDDDQHLPGTVCQASCMSEAEKVVGDSSITCNDDKRWEAQVMPSCVECKVAKPVELVAMIHESENYGVNYRLAVRVISKTVTVLQRKFRLRPIVKVNRYATNIDETAEFSTFNFNPTRDIPKIEAIPFPGNFDDTANALDYIGKRLIVDRTTQVALILTNRMDYTEAAKEAAEKLKGRGITIIVVTIPQRNRVKTWSTEDLVSLTGDESLVHHVENLRRSEQLKHVIADQINDAAKRKGCGMDDKA